MEETKPKKKMKKEEVKSEKKEKEKKSEKKPVKKIDSDDEEEEEEKKEIKQKKSEKKPVKKMESDDDDEEEEEKIKPKKSEKKSVKKMESDGEEEEEMKPKKSEKKPVKKVDSDDEEDSEEKPKKGEKKSEKKPPIKKEIDDSDSDSESQKKPKKEEKEEKKEDSDDEKEEEENGAKKTAKKEESSNEEEENDKEKEEELPENAYEELFVRNIGYNTTQEGLADFFAKYGDVEESKIVTDKNTGKSRGFGFLKFYEKKSAVAAMKDADNIVVDGRNLQIRYSNDKSSQMKGGNGNSAKKGPATEFGVFVGNISYKCTDNDLKKFFKDCGKVVDVRIAKKPDGKLKGFAHVDFETKEAMEKAVEKNGKELQGRPLKIDKSSSGNGKGGNKGQGRGKGGRDNADPMAKAKRTGGIIAPTENKVTTYDDSDDDE